MAMLLPKCGERHITSQVNSTFDINKSNFLFGLLRHWWRKRRCLNRLCCTKKKSLVWDNWIANYSSHTLVALGCVTRSLVASFLVVYQFIPLTKVFLTDWTREEDGFLAREYRLCWCQAHPGTPGTPGPVCDQPEHFLADIGAATWRCGGKHPKKDVIFNEIWLLWRSQLPDREKLCRKSQFNVVCRKRVLREMPDWMVGIDDVCVYCNPSSTEILSL